jgi:hypothetical protein
MKRFYNFIILLALVSTLFSCTKEEDKVEYTAVKTMAGQWYVQFLDATGKDIKAAHIVLLTSCTSSNSADSLVIADMGSIWEFSVTTKVDVNAQTFSVSNKQNYYYSDGDKDGNFTNYNIKINVTEGSIKTGTKKLPSGTMADEISLKIEFSDDPGSIYTIKGFRVSGFLEDVPTDLKK